MYAFIVIVIFLLILAVIFYREYKNEKAYQKDRETRHVVNQHKTRPLNQRIKHTEPQSPKKTTLKPLDEKAQQSANLQKKLDSAIKTVAKSTQEKELRSTREKSQKNKLDMPKYNYVPFDHSRLVKMGFADKEAKEFVLELIPQIASQMPVLKEAIEKKDIALIDEITHDIKGSSGNIGSGGISDLMNDLNAYIKRGDDTEVLQAYYKHVEHYYKELKQQYHA